MLVLIGLYIRLQLEESPVFKEAKAEIEAKKDEASHMPILEVIKSYPKEVFIAMGMRMAENISYYIFTIVSITYVTTYLEPGQGPDPEDAAHRCRRAVLLDARVGALSDKVGRRPLYFAGAVGVGVWGFVFFGLLDTSSPGQVMLAVVVGLFFHTLMYAPQAAFFSELFGTSVRYTGASVGYQLASIFAGALAPIIAVKLLGDAGDVEHLRGRRLRRRRRGAHDHRRALRRVRPGPPRCATTAWCGARTTDPPDPGTAWCRTDPPPRRGPTRTGPPSRGGAGPVASRARDRPQSRGRSPAAVRSATSVTRRAGSRRRLASTSWTRAARCAERLSASQPPGRPGSLVERRGQVVGHDEVLDVVEQRPGAVGPRACDDRLARPAASGPRRTASPGGACWAATSRCRAGGG